MATVERRCSSLPAAALFGGNDVLIPAPVPASSHLTTATNRALELALRSPQDGKRDLQNALRELCAEARRQGMRSEQLIMLFKKTWAERPELRTMSREETSRLFDEMVTMCIAEYYDGPR